MTKITSSPNNLSTPVYTAPPEPDATTSGAQAQEGSPPPHQPRRDSPSRALRALHKQVQDSPLTALPYDMQKAIVECMDNVSRSELRLACQDLEQVVSKHVQHVTISNRDHLREAIEAYKDGGITKLILNGPSFTDDDLALLQGLPRLEHLELILCTGLTGACLAYLRQLTSLEHLDLSGGDLRDDDLAHLQQMTSLKHLDLSRCTDLTDEGLAYLRQLTSLRHLDLSRCTGLTGTGLTHLRPPTSLQHLGMRRCTGLTDVNFAYLGQITSLQHLHLSGCRQLTDACLPYLQPLTSLQYLNLFGSNNLTMAGMELLRDRIGENLVIER